MYTQHFLKTERLNTAYYRAGEEHEKKLLLIHGNVSSSVFYLPLFPELSKQFDVVAPDLRCFGDSDALPIDATRGFRDWTDDLHELVRGLGWDKYAIAGWSMGGCIAYQMILEHAEDLTGVILINPGSPFGFGGTKGETGELLDPPGLGSGGGIVNQQLVQCLMTGERELPRTTLHSVYFKPTWQIPEGWEDRFIDSMLKTRLGDGMYPGDFVPAPVWPFLASGSKGICNTMSPVYGNMSGIADHPVKPPILWVRGDGDVMVSDTSVADMGYLGQLGAVPGWPGAEVYPPQPMVSQTRYVLEKYKANGGDYREVVLPGGHCCPLESPEQFCAEVRALLI